MAVIEIRHSMFSGIYRWGQDAENANENTEIPNIQWSKVGRMSGLNVEKCSEAEHSHLNWGYTELTYSLLPS